MKRRDAMRGLAAWAVAAWAGGSGGARGRVVADGPAPVGGRALEAPPGREGEDLARPRVLVFDRTGGRVAAGGLDGFVGVWDAATGRLVTAFRALQHGVVKLALSPDGRRLVAAGPGRMLVMPGGLGEAFREDGAAVRAWDLGARRLVAELTPPEQVASLGFAADPPGVLLVSGRGLTRWDPDGGRSETRPLPDLAGPGESLSGGGAAFDARGTRVAAIASWSNPEVEAPAAKALVAWAPAGGRARVLDFPVRPDNSGPIALSRDGSQLAVAVYGTRRPPALLDPGTGAPLRRPAGLPALPRACRGLAFSPDGTRLAAAGYDGSEDHREIVQVIDLATGREFRSPPGPPGPVRALAYLADGRVRAMSGGFADPTVAAAPRPRVPLTVWEYEPPAPP